MKSIVLEGQVSEAPCERCQRFVPARFAYGPVELDGGLVVESVMRATCDECGAVLALAPQSAYLLRRALLQQKKRRTTVRLPQELADFIALKLSLVGMRPSKVDLFFRALLLAARGHEKKLGKEFAPCGGRGIATEAGGDGESLIEAHRAGSPGPTPAPQRLAQCQRSPP